MDGPVLSTERARAAARQMRSLLDGRISTALQGVRQCGQTLSDATKWDGPLAARYRAHQWPALRTTINGALAAVERVGLSAEAVIDDIMRAGGQGNLTSGSQSIHPDGPASGGQPSSGSMDRMPAAARDQVNRKLLDDRIARLRRELDSDHNPFDHWDSSLAMSKQRDLDIDLQLKARLDPKQKDVDGQQLYYLLDFDPDHHHAIVAVGNPDRATNTAVFVPGANTGWGSVNNDVDTAGQLHDQAQFNAPHARVSTILWEGTDFPTLTQGGDAHYAEDAVKPLDSFVNGLRTTHQGRPTDLTLIGHSYGSTMVGHAVAHSQSSLPVDNVVFTGSPGTGVDNASQLHLPPGAHVYAAAHNDDEIVSLFGEHLSTLGRPPTDAGYGATRIPTRDTWEGGGHDYLNPSGDPVAFHNIARIIVGQPLIPS